jgi:ADP-ribose pyrophosphatase
MKHKNAERYGFKITSMVLEHENPFFTVHKYEVNLPSGGAAPFWIVEQNDFPVVIPLFKDKTTVLVGQYRVSADYYSWEFPMGAASSEDMVEDGKRELQEETGYTAKDWRHIGDIYVAPGRSNMKGIIYIAENLVQGLAQPEGVEFLQTKRLSIPEVGKMIESGTIMDGSTIVAYHYLENYLKTL